MYHNGGLVEVDEVHLIEQSNKRKCNRVSNIIMIITLCEAFMNMNAHINLVKY